MKSPKNLLLFCLMLTGFCINAQVKPSLKATLNCAKSDNTVLSSDAGTCDKIVLNGPNAGDYKIVSALVSVNINDVIKEFQMNSENLSKECQGILQSLAASDLTKHNKIFVESVQVVKSNDPNQEKIKLPTTKLTMKK